MGAETNTGAETCTRAESGGLACMQTGDSSCTTGGGGAGKDDQGKGHDEGQGEGQGEGGGAGKEDGQGEGGEVFPDPLMPVRDPAFDESLARALGEVSGAIGIQSTTQAGHGFAKTAQVNAQLYEIPMPDQTYACISVAGPTQFTKAASCHLRLVGFYPSEGERRMHMDDLPPGNFFPVECGKPYTFGSRKFASVDEEKEYVRVMVDRFEKRAMDHNHAFDGYVQQRSEALHSKETELELRQKEKEKFAEQARKRAATSEALALARVSDAPQKAAAEALAEALAEARAAAKADAEAAEVAEAAAAKARAETEAAKAQELKAVHALHDQSWAVIALMHDLDQDADPIKTQWVFVLYGAFPTEGLANGHLSDTVQHAVPYMRCFVVKMYKWLELDQVNTKEIRATIKGVYPAQRQQELWDGARDSKPKARRFKAAQEKAEREQKLQAERRDAAAASQTAALAPALAAQTTADMLRHRLTEENARDVLARGK